MPGAKRSVVKAPTPGKSAAQTKAGSRDASWRGPGARIRMYRPGLGDCFLLSFADGENVRHVLIDCGVFTGTSGGKERLRAIAEHIAQATAGSSKSQGGLTAVVATHEHWDHVAGFYHAEDVFRRIAPEQVWVAWTEDPEQSIAREAKNRQRRMAAALQLAVEKLAASPSVYDRECAGVIGHVLEFGESTSEASLGAAFSERTNQGVEFVTEGFGVTPRYLKPGDVISLDWAPGGLRVYVLGPPMDREALVQGRVPRAEGFGGADSGGAQAAWMAAVLGAAGPADPRATLFGVELEGNDHLRPFDAARALPEEEVFREIQRKKAPVAELKRVKSSVAAWTSKMALFSDYAAEDWRRIDSDWLQSAASLALQLDRSINNTSLVLAFEFVHSGKVLLFVGDAELESWKSWQSLVFEVPGEDRATRKVTARELFQRTVFYKVGHHGSGNATLRAALDQMTSPELAAAIPTDEVFARDKKGWAMPSALLRPALQAQTRGRVLDATPSANAIEAPEGNAIAPKAWKRFTDAVGGGAPADLFVDYWIDP